MLEHWGPVLALLCAILAIAYGLLSAQWITRQPAGNERMQEIAAAIQEDTAPASLIPSSRICPSLASL